MTMAKKTKEGGTADPVLKALQNAKPRTTPLSDELREKSERGLREVAAGDFADVYGRRQRLQN
jgi:hypothetical protein